MKWRFRQTWDKITHSTFLGRVMVVLIVLAILAVAMILSGPKPPGDFDPFAPTPTPLITNATGIPPSPPSSEYKLTNGVVLGVVSVVVIILIGTIFYVIRYNKMNRE
jgi:Fe2+ transport system protein B